MADDERNAPEDDIFETVMACKPVLSRENMQSLERAISGTGALAVARRLGIATACQGGDFFRRLTEDREMALVAPGQLDSFDEAALTFREITDILECGATRTRVALCAYDDVEDLLHQAKAYAAIVNSEGRQCVT